MSTQSLEDSGDGGGIEVLIPEDALGIGTGTDVLVVDDSDTNLVAYEAALAPLGRKLVLARSGIEALGQLLDHDFALIILDFSMPGMSGLETARMVRDRPRSQSTPILFISGASPPTETMLEAFDVGALDFISKPIVPEVLRAKVSVYLRLQERTQQLLHKTILLRDAYQRLESSATAETEREAATGAAVRLEKLQEATAALADARTAEDVGAVAVRSGSAAVAASAACMWITRTDGSLSLVASHGVPEAYVDQWRTISVDSDIPAARVARSRQPLWIETEADFVREMPTTVELARAANRVAPFALLPLVAHNASLGVMTFTYEGHHTFTTDERRFLFALTRACVHALERARLNEAEVAARRAAEIANKRKDEFLAMLGHELRNPLAAMMTAVDLVRMRAGGEERETSVLARHLAHLTHIVDDLVDVSRITRGVIRLRREAVDLASVVSMAIESVQPHIARAQHELGVNVPEGILVDADRNRLCQVIANLLSNAVSYTPPGGRIELTAEAHDELASIVVRDNGRGITPTLLTDLFELFVQGERAPDRQEGGLGIGLTLVRTLVQLHGGSIHVTSDGPGTGAAFTVQWPLASRATATAKMPATVVAQRSSGRRRVLIVDDNHDAAELLATVVETLGHIVKVVHHGRAALEVAHELAPEVVLLDIGLPELDGYEVARRLRALPSCAATVLIAVTGYGQPEDRARSLEAGFADHLVKPVQLQTLRSVFAALDEAET